MSMQIGFMKFFRALPGLLIKSRKLINSFGSGGPGITFFLILLLLVTGACQPEVQLQDTGAPELEKAQQALVSFLNALHAGNYDEAAILYGGNYETLKNWNPEADPENLAGLLQSACQINGLQCLEIRGIGNARKIDQQTYTFSVEFSSSDGNLFQRGPCCGADETEMPTQVSFSFTVMKTGDTYQVLDLPPYMP